MKYMYQRGGRYVPVVKFLHINAPELDKHIEQLDLASRKIGEK